MRYSQKYISDFGILRDYDGKCFKLTRISRYRKRGIEENRVFVSKGNGGNTEKLENSLSRTKSIIKELCLCNPWEWFVTLTLDPVKYNRFDLPKFIKDLSQMLRDYRKRSGNPLKYLLIPERHKDGCWHLHGLFLGLPVSELHVFTISEHLPYRLLNRLKSGVSVYTWEKYSSRFGFASIEPICNQEAVSSYIVKYITKDALRTISELNSHAFYASKGLKRSSIVFQDVLCREIENPDFSNKYCDVKWFSDLETALLPFAGDLS